MIDASTFAISYNAFWHANTPTCEHFIRRLNLNGLDRMHPPMPPSNTTNRRALIAEYAFSLFVERRNAQIAGSTFNKEVAWLDTVSRLAPYAIQGLDIQSELSDEEEQEVDSLTNRLELFFNASRPIVLRPQFVGCGYVDASEGDVIFGQTLFEVKTVERPVRSSDIRQTITYAALNAASNKFDLDSVGLFNPRRGQYCMLDLEQVCFEISGLSAQELLTVIIQALSSGEISR